MKTKIKKEVIKEFSLNSLSFLPFNRRIRLNHIETMYLSLLKYGILRFPVVVATSIFTGKSEHYIMDGQHLISGMVRAGETKCRCIVIKLDTKEQMVDTIAQLNNTSKSWTLHEYVTTFSSIGKESYEFILRKSIESGVNVNAIAEIYSSTVSPSRLIKSGDFTVDRMEQGEKIFQYLKDIMKFIGTTGHSIQGFVRFYRGLSHHKYNHTKMMRRLELSKTNWKSLDISAVVYNLNEIYTS